MSNFKRRQCCDCFILEWRYEQNISKCENSFYKKVFRETKLLEWRMEQKLIKPLGMDTYWENKKIFMAAQVRKFFSSSGAETELLLFLVQWCTFSCYPYNKDLIITWVFVPFPLAYFVLRTGIIWIQEKQF